MPELPEVQTVKTELNKKLKNKEITNIEVLFDKILKNISKEEFIKTLTGKTIKEVRRKGKYLILDIDKYSLLIHLRMEGKLFYYDKKEEVKKHDHIIFKFKDNSELHYNDVRKFGTFDLVLNEKENEYKKIEKLGLEPLTNNFTLQNLTKKLNKSNKKIKLALLDQEVVSGLGNIYVDEVLYAAKIHPNQISKTLNKKDIENIIKYSNEILQKAIEENGTTIKSFSASDQIKGNYQNYLKVYSKQGQKCPRCKDTIKKIKVGARGTHYCPTCQRIK